MESRSASDSRVAKGRHLLGGLLALAASAASQDTATNGPAAWADLDAQIQALTASLDDGELDVELEGYVKLYHRSSSDPVFTVDPITFMPGPPLQDFVIGSVGFSGKVTLPNGFQAKLAFNPASERLRTTYVRFRPSDSTRLTLGRYKAPLLRSRLVSTRRLLFTERTAQARQTGPRDEGAKLEVDLAENVELILSAQNGEDSSGDENYLVGRVQVELLGGGVKNYEGAYKAPDHPALTVGWGKARDETLSHGRYRAADLAFTWGPFSFAGEVLDYPEDQPVFVGQDKIYDFGILDPISRITWSGTRPFDLTTSYMIVDDEFEIAVRWEEFDDANRTTRLGVAFNRYIDGHNLKWQANTFRVDSDLPLLESELFVFGLVFNF